MIIYRQNDLLSSLVITSRAFFRFEFQFLNTASLRIFTTQQTRTDRLKQCKMLAASSTSFAKAQWGAARNNTRELETSDKREGVDGNERRARAGSDPRFP